MKGAANQSPRARATKRHVYSTSTSSKMAPISLHPSIFEPAVSSLELDRRASPADLSSHQPFLPLSDRHISDTLPSLTRRSSIDSPLIAASVLRARDPANPQYTPGSASIPPTDFNNKAIFIVFGLVFASLVLLSIWFFFRAENGGFRFRKGDWEDYKSTVLRRKGPDGKTLSNATKSTELGGGSIVAETDRSSYLASEPEKPRRDKRGKKKHSKNRHDNDVRAYRQEKPARVGGLNREPDGSYHDYSATDPSEASHPLAYKNKKKNKETVPAPATPSPTKEKRSRQFSYAPGTESTFSVYSDDSHRPLRATTHHHHSNSRDSTPARTPTRSRQSSPVKSHSHHTPTHKPRSSASHTNTNTRSTTHNSSYVDPIDFANRYGPTASETGTDETRGTKAYFHPLPGLSMGGTANGFRRGGGRRRDSLSDSDGETGTVRS